MRCAATSLIKRFASPEEVAALVIYIASPWRQRRRAPPCG
jgi:NAD(P)-dependent dehydrogenase (short-subunit alcohol dehydrogenase family)